MARFVEFLDPDMPTPSAFNFKGVYESDDDYDDKQGGASQRSVRFATDIGGCAETGNQRSPCVGLYNKEIHLSPVAATSPYPLQTFPRSHRHCHPPQLKSRDVFERLTDHRFFTGMHRERFDENGNGRGLAGREDVYIYDGNTPSTSRIHEVYSTVLRKPHKPVIPRGTLGMQKYGVQISTPKLMWLYRNGDKFHDGVAFYVRPFIKNMDILFMEMSKELTLIAGPIRKIYDQNLQVITRLEDIVDGAKYLCTSGEPPATANRLKKFMSEWVIQPIGH
ncbi:hypothetical protein X943_000913 [Babesia divergens]|uniref:Doublecortin domain-containing protein n=1 Tax=Babesia divergens TaxID=32595 RepID=A0AAD9GH54_BABDI|nr:hypothetical protein X943_000913 [Babesia divergens]